MSIMDRPSRRSTLLGGASLVGAAAATGTAFAQSGPIKIGDLNSYNRWSAFAGPVRAGWQLALEQINAAGGVMGRKLEVVSRDDGGTPTDAVRAAEDLVSREGATILMGTFLSNVSLAVADFAKQRRVVFMPAIAASDTLSLEGGNPYTFHFRGNVFMYSSMLVDEGAKTSAKRWAIVAPNYDFGQSAAKAFKRLLAQKMPGATIVAEQYPPLGKVDGGAIANALEEAKPDGIFNVLFGADLALFVRDGSQRGLFDNRVVLSIGSGYPEYLLPMKDQAPVGWITQGYPSAEITEPAHKAFVDAFKAKYGDLPGAFALHGFLIVNLLKDAIAKAGSTQPDAVAAAMRGAEFSTIVGPLRVRALDNKVTMGSWVGRTILRNGSGALADWKFLDGANYMIPEADVKASRPG